LDEDYLILTMIHSAKGKEIGAPVAARPDGKPWPDRQSFAKAWRKYATAAGLPKYVWNNHADV
jgi:hypothetical protein